MKNNKPQAHIPQTSSSNKTPTTKVNECKQPTMKALQCFLTSLPMVVVAVLVVIGEHFHDNLLVHASIQCLLIWMKKYTPVELDEKKKVQRKRRKRRKR